MTIRVYGCKCFIMMSCRVNCYIKYGWDQYLIDPDRGANCQKKLSLMLPPQSLSHDLIRSLPKYDDPQWTTRLHQLPKVTFSTIYSFLVDRKVSLKKVSYLEGIAERNVELTHTNKEGDFQKFTGHNVPIEYTRTLSKAYVFFKDGHVQDIKYHPFPQKPDYVCVKSKVLPSMRKDRVYTTVIVLHNSTAHVASAHCTCPAGLLGCCNHVTATLYCLEEYIYSGLYEDDLKGCTDRLQKWNRPRKRNVEPRPTDKVTLSKQEYGIEKRAKVHRVNSWDCRPVSRRIVNPNKARNMRNRLSLLEQDKISAADEALSSAITPIEKKKASQTKSMLTRYGTSCFLQLLDEEAPSVIENRIETMKMKRQERLERAAAQRKKFLDELCALQQCVDHDHSYSCLPDSSMVSTSKDEMPFVRQDMVDNLYHNHVCLSPEACIQLEASTRMQSCSERWVNERKLRMTASIMKEVCHRKATTSCEAFVRKKLTPRHIDTAAIRYGNDHESTAVKSYVDYQNKHGKVVKVNSCGLSVHPSTPWVAGSPDGIVFDPTEERHNRGCLEVKCPQTCEKVPLTVACRDVSGFCLALNNCEMFLLRSHAYYYQVQTQMYVTQLQWCDFVVWSPVPDIFVERISYDPEFMKTTLRKAQEFYFQRFLPSVVPCMIISDERELQVQPTKVDGYNHMTPTVPSGEASTETACISSASMSKTVLPSSITKTVLPSSITKTILPSSATKTVKPNSVAKTNLPASVIQSISLTNASNPQASVTKTIQSISVTKSNPPAFVPKTIQPISVTNPPTSIINTDDIKITSITKHNSSPLSSVLQLLNFKKHSVYGDGSCLYHAIAHQAGFINGNSKGCTIISKHLRQMVLKVMTDYPAVRLEDGLSTIQWLERKKAVLDPTEWGGDLEIRLLAIGLKRDIVVLTAACNSASYARKFPSKPPPITKMRGGIFIPLSTDELCRQWQSLNPRPLLIVYNGYSHYDSTVQLVT